VGLVKVRSTATTGLDANKHIPLFTDTLISRLTQTRRFQLIDRQEVDQLLDEQLAQALAENRDLPSAMGTLAGADYLVVGSIANFVVEQVSMKLPGSQRLIVTHQGRVEGNMRIVDARSGEVLDSRKVSILEELAAPEAADQLISRLADIYAEQTVINLMNTIYPIKVAAVVSGIAYINRGTDGGLAVGETLLAVRPGEAIIDPDTGVRLGFAEQELGEVALAEVEDARAKVVSDRLQRGDILKRRPEARGRRSGEVAKQTAPVRSGGSAGQAGGAALTLAVGKIRLNPRGRNGAARGANLDRVSNDLMVKLSQFPEFDVMERAEIDQVIDEKSFTAIAQGRSLPGAMRELEGADYLVITTIDDFLIRVERKPVPYTDEVQTRYFGTVESTLRMVDVHSGRLVAADKVRLRERLRDGTNDTDAVADLFDLYSSELVYRISDNLKARQRGEDSRPERPLLDAQRPKPKMPEVRRPKF
jgi:curli biogenesis system outer membrane secretion channel CsgG